MPRPGLTTSTRESRWYVGSAQPQLLREPAGDVCLHADCAGLPAAASAALAARRRDCHSQVHRPCVRADQRTDGLLSDTQGAERHQLLDTSDAADSRAATEWHSPHAASACQRHTRRPGIQHVVLSDAQQRQVWLVLCCAPDSTGGLIT